MGPILLEKSRHRHPEREELLKPCVSAIAVGKKKIRMRFLEVGEYLNIEVEG